MIGATRITFGTNGVRDRPGAQTLAQLVPRSGAQRRNTRSSHSMGQLTHDTMEETTSINLEELPCQ